MRFSRWILPILISVSFGSSAYAWELAVVAGLNHSRPSLNPDPPNGATLSSKATFDFGILSEISVSNDYRFETGLIRHSRSTLLESTASTTETSYSGWLIPLTFRFMRAEFLGFGFGPYVGVLNAHTKTTTTYPSGGSVVVEGDDANRKSYEIGLRANLRIAIPVYRSVKAVVDGSYLFGFTDLNKSGTAEDKTQELLLLVGLQIPLDSNPVPEKEAPK